MTCEVGDHVFIRGRLDFGTNYVHHLLVETIDDQGLPLTGYHFVANQRLACMPINWPTPFKMNEISFAGKHTWGRIKRYTFSKYARQNFWVVKHRQDWLVDPDEAVARAKKLYKDKTVLPWSFQKNCEYYILAFVYKDQHPCVMSLTVQADIYTGFILLITLVICVQIVLFSVLPNIYTNIWRKKIKK